MTALRPIVMSGPSGVGKSTILKKLFNDFPGRFGFSVSHTSRGPREGEEDGVDYHFSSKDAMTAAVARGEFIESATFGGNMYGTSKKSVHDVAANNMICILDVDEQGVQALKLTELCPIYIFIKPPSMDELERRLRSRGTETEEKIQARMDTAKSAIDYAESGAYDHLIVNDDLPKAYEEIVEILKKMYPILTATSADVRASGDAAIVEPKEKTIITVESSVQGQGTQPQNENPEVWWCVML